MEFSPRNSASQNSGTNSAGINQSFSDRSQKRAGLTTFRQTFEDDSLTSEGERPIEEVFYVAPVCSLTLTSFCSEGQSGDTRPRLPPADQLTSGNPMLAAVREPLGDGLVVRLRASVGVPGPQIDIATPERDHGLAAGLVFAKFRQGVNEPWHVQPAPRKRKTVDYRFALGIQAALPTAGR